MGDEELRQTLYRLLGWTEISFYEDNSGPSFWSGRPPGQVGADKNGEWQWKTVEHRKPLPPMDANTVAEVRKGLSRDQQHAMIPVLFELLDIVGEAEHGAVEITCACILFDATERLQTIAIIYILQ